MFPYVDPVSISHWDDCLYGGPRAFGTNRTSEVGWVSDEQLRDHLRAERQSRIRGPYGDDYYQELDKMPLAGKNVLEFGCGSGIDALYFSESGANVLAYDIVPANIVLSERILKPYPLSRAMLLKTYDQLSGDSDQDVVYSHGCLHHIPTSDAREVMKLLARRLRRGGTCLVMVYTAEFYPYPNRHYEGPYTRGYTKDQLVELIGPLCSLNSYRILNNGTFSWGCFTKARDEV